MAEGGAPVTPISKAGVPFPVGTEDDPIFTDGGSGGGGPVTVADGADVTQGAVADAAVAAGAAGTTSAKLRRLTTDIGAMAAVEGTTAGAAVVTDANGTIQQYLRGLVVLFVSFLTRIPAALGAGGGLKIDGSGTALPVSGPMTSTEFLADLRSTAAFTSVNSAASSTTILASNANRKGAVIVNTDANALYLDLTGGTAATTRYATALSTGEEYEVPFGLTGLITGIWAADGSGAALVTEFS